MCGGCDRDLENYNRSLRNKTNLLNAEMDRRDSFVERPSPSDAPKNNRKDSFDSGDEYDQVLFSLLNSFLALHE